MIKEWPVHMRLFWLYLLAQRKSFLGIALITNSFHTWLGTVPKIRYSLPIIAEPMETAIWRF